jgi:hypothetical protein
MNKLLLIFLLSILILYAQCTDPCIGTPFPESLTGTKADFCGTLTPSTNSKECVLKADESACEETAKPCSTPIPNTETTDSAKTQFCEGLLAAANKKCQLKSDKTACEEVSKPTNSANSGSILNAFKITFTLIIIFAIL